jgi:hypothetical protein
MIVVGPVPAVCISPGCLVSVHPPAEGRLFNAMLPLFEVQVGFVMLPTDGGEGLGLTVRVYVAMALVQGTPRGLSDVIVMVTILPASAGTGV